MIELDRAELARERRAYAEAEGLYTRALELLAPADEALRLLALRGRGRVIWQVGRGAEALADLVLARGLAQKTGDAEAEIELLLDEATALDWCNDFPAAATRAEEAEARATATGCGSRALRAALLVARGRTHFRAGRWSEAWDVLQQAVESADPLGAAGYEPLVVALILLEVVLPYLGRTPEAEAAAERAIALAKARGDGLNLASAINNRRNLLVARKDLEAALADQRTFREIGRELGLSLAEYYAEFNLAELHYQAGDTEAAAPFAERAASFEERMPLIAPRPSARLLQARLCTFRGLEAEARVLLGRIEESVRLARAEDRATGLLSPSEEVLLSMVDLSTRDATEAEWDTLVARSGRDSLEQEPIEVLEMRARFHRRRGRNEQAERRFAEALALASKIPNLLELRMKRERTDLRA